MTNQAEPSSRKSEVLSPEHQGGLKRRLTLRDVIAQSVTVIAPGTSGASLSYLASTKAGGATPLAFVFAALGALAVASVVASFAKTLPAAGSLYAYTASGLSRTAGFVVGWMYSLAFIALAAGVLSGFAFFMSLLVQSLTGSAAFVSWWWFAIGGLAFLAAVSLFGVRVSTRLQLLSTGLSVVAMLLAAIAVIVRGSPEGTAQAGKSLDLGAFWPPAAGVPWSGMVLGFAFGMLSFTGFEAGAVLAEETENPKRNIPRAVIGSVLVSGAFYGVITYATAIGFGVREAAEKWPSSAQGLAAVTTTKTLTNLVLFAAASSSLFAALGVHTAVTRFLFAMGRERVLPSALSRIHRRWRTPVTATVTSLFVYIVLIWGLLQLSSENTQIALGGGATETGPALPTTIRGSLVAFSYWASFATPAIMFAYLLLGLAGIRRGRARHARGLAVAGGSAAIAGTLGVVGSLYYSFVEPIPGTGIVPLVASIPASTGVLLAVGLVIAAYLRSNRPDNWQHLGNIFDDETD
jgi:amino acid transporter